MSNRRSRAAAHCPVSLPPCHPGSNQLGPIYGHTSVTTGSLLDDHHWHSVVIERQGRSIDLTLDRSVQHFRTNGEFDYLDLDYEVNCGRGSGARPGAASAPT